MDTTNTRPLRPAVLLAGLTGLFALQLLFFASASGSVAFAAEAPGLATQLGVSAVAAERLMNLLGSWYFTVLLAALTGGWGAGLVRIAVWMASRYGRRYAIAW